MKRQLGKVIVGALALSFWVSVLAGQPTPAALAMIEQLGLREHGTPSREIPGWHSPQKVVAWLPVQDQLASLRKILPGVEVVAVQTPRQALAEIADADVLLGFCDESILAAAVQLRWLQAYWAGVEDCVNSPRLQSGQVTLTNGQRLGSPALAEHAIAMMMMLMRGLDLHHAKQLDGVWDPAVGNPRNTFLELEGRTVLVVGLGGIGSQVARRAHALGMRVIATRGSRREGPAYVEYVGLADEVVGLAARADVVINTVPLTAQTRGMFNEVFFASMKESAYFISVGRGGTTVTDDLVAALTAGEIAGAGLDVTDPEPLPANHPLWSMPRVLITPHTAARSDRSLARLWLLVQENVRRYAAGEPLLSVVDVQRGY